MYAHIQDSMLHTRATDRTFRSFHPRAAALPLSLPLSSSLHSLSLSLSLSVSLSTELLLSSVLPTGNPLVSA